MDADIIVVGAGVVGIATARAIVHSTGATVILVEALPVVLQGASSGNSAMIHTGFDCTPGTLESRMVHRGHELFEGFVTDCARRRVHLPWSPLGALMLAMSPQELEEMKDTVVPKAKANNVPVQLLSRCEVLALEPHVARDNVCGGVLVPGEWCVDPWYFPALLLAEAVSTGRAKVIPAFRVTAVKRDESKMYVVTSAKGQSIKARLVINAAGLHGTRVESLRQEYATTPQTVPFDVFPRLGRFLVFDASASPLIGRALLPLPTKKTKGIILFKSVYGQVIIGPTAEDPDEPRKAQSEVRQLLLNEAVKKVPTIAACPVVSHYAGARPSLRGQSDYFLKLDKAAAWFTLAGVRSTGLTSSLAIGEYVAQSLHEHFSDEKWIVSNGRAIDALPALQIVTASLSALIAKGVLNTEVRHPLSFGGWPNPKL